MPRPNGQRGGRTAALMLQGTGSDVGKSLLVAGLARALTRRGHVVRPFKPQNMSNNAAVTADGGEIGRAQALQARACGVAPSCDMNPVLLKPQSEIGAQVVVQGRVLRSATARDYHALKADLLPAVLDSFARICGAADIVLIEGAGSAAEVNLRQSDIANMGFAEAADVSVVLVGDIDRGGVIASLVGTHALLAADERARLKGYIINKFRGDPTLFDGALETIRQRTGLACHGLVPFFAAARDLPAEDGLALDVIEPGRPLPGDADLVLLPGSKSTLADLAALRAEGWDIDILAHVRRGGRVLGLCAGFQMLGHRIADPTGIEGPAGAAEGLGLLDVDTILGAEKTLREVEGSDIATGQAVRGYEMHVGATTGPGLAHPMLRLAAGGAGAVSGDGRIAGCYLHGLFAGDAFRRAFIAGLGGVGDAKLAYEARVETTLDALAAHLERHLDIAALLGIAHAR